MEGINLELKLFLASVIWGAALVIFYDCLRIFRRVIKHNKFCVGLEDIIYWAVSAVLIFKMMYQINDGAIRGFAIVGVGIGMVLYHYSISEFVVGIVSLGITKCLIAGKRVIKFTLKPVVWFGRRFHWFFWYLNKIFKRPVRFARKSLKKIWKQVKIAVVKK